MKRIIRLTESDLTRIVRRIIKESTENLPTPYSIGGVQLLGGCSTSKSGSINNISDNKVEIEINGVPSKNYDQACENRTKAFEPKSLIYDQLPYLYKREFVDVSDVKIKDIKKHPDPIYKFIFSLDNDEIFLTSASVTYVKPGTTEEITEDLLSRVKKLFFIHTNGEPRKVRNEDGKLDIYFAPLSFYKMFGLTN
jgi:hypothetical protein